MAIIVEVIVGREEPKKRNQMCLAVRNQPRAKKEFVSCHKIRVMILIGVEEPEHQPIEDKRPH